MKPILMFLLILTQMAFGQSRPSSQKKPTGAYPVNADTSRVMDIREKLVQLALQNPTYEMADNTVAIERYTVRLAKSNWLSIVTIAGNINEFTISPEAANGNIYALYYPKYNFGISIPLNYVGLNSNNVKIARMNLLNAEAARNDKFRQIKADVLTRYEDYLLAKEMVEFQTRISQDQYELYKRGEKDYEDGLIKLEEYDKFYINWTAEQIKLLTYKRNLNVMKLDLERMTGVSLDSILQQYK
jgi:outer membrane protein TolC